MKKIAGAMRAALADGVTPSRAASLAADAIGEARRLREAAAQMRRPHEALWALSMAFLRGAQGMRIRGGRLTLVDGIDAFYSNQIRPRHRAMVSGLTANRPTAHVVAADDDDTTAKGAVPLAQEILEGYMRYLSFDKKIRSATHGAAARGNGYLHAGFDASLGPTVTAQRCASCGTVLDEQQALMMQNHTASQAPPSGPSSTPLQSSSTHASESAGGGCPACGGYEVEVEEFNQGDLFLNVLRSDQVYLDPSSTTLDDVDYMVIEHQYGEERAAASWPTDVFGAPVTFQEETITSDLDIISAKTLGVSSQPARRAVRIFELLVPGRDDYALGLRFLFLDAGTVLDYRERISADGRLPVAEIVADEDDASAWKRGIVPDLIPLQISFNEEMRKLAKLSDLSQDPRLLAQEGSLRFDNALDSGEQVIYYAAGAMKPEFERPPIVSPVFSEMIDRLSGQMDLIAQQFQPSRGQPGGGVTSGLQARLLIERTATSMAAMTSSIEAAVARIGKVLLTEAKEWLDDERVLSFAGEHGAPKVLRFQKADLVGFQDVVVVPGSGFPESREARREFLLAAAGRVVAIQDPTIRRSLVDALGAGLRLPDDPLAVVRDKARAENDRLAAGEFVAVAESDIHEIEIAEHRFFQQTEAYGALAPPARAMFDAHVFAHKEAQYMDAAREQAKAGVIARAAAALAPPPPPPSGGAGEMPEGGLQ